jgi:hypothetical protein
VSVRFSDEITTRPQEIDTSTTILFDSPHGAPEPEGAPAPKILVEQQQRAHHATFFIRSPQFAFDTPIVAHSARHRAENHRARCESC